MAEEKQQKELSKGQSEEPSSRPGSQIKSWPELVGLTSGEAVRRRRQEMPKFEVIPQNSVVTMDLRRDRVRIFSDPAGIVAWAPTIG